jgi:AAA+ ATPase superfamily predicted ATPase
MIRQTIHQELLKRLKEKRRFVQVLAGPRQVGKTTVVRQVMEASKIAVEVKSGARRASLPGMEVFARTFKPQRQLLVGGQGIALEEFLSKPAAHWL